MSEPEKQDIRQLVRSVQPELPDAGLSSILSETTVVSTLNESDFLNEHKSIIAGSPTKDQPIHTEKNVGETPKHVFKEATPFLNSVLSTSSMSSDDSFVVSRRRDVTNSSSILGDSILDLNSGHSSFFNSNESSFFLPSVVPHRRSIRESQYSSLLMPDSKRVSSYDSLLRTSEAPTTKSYHSLFTGLTTQENPSLSSSTLSASTPYNLSTLSSRLSEYNGKQNMSVLESSKSLQREESPRLLESGKEELEKQMRFGESHPEEQVDQVDHSEGYLSEQDQQVQTHSDDNLSEQDHSELMEERTHSDDNLSEQDQQDQTHSDDNLSEQDQQDQPEEPVENTSEEHTEDTLDKQTPSESILEQSHPDDSPDSFMSDIPNNFSNEEPLSSTEEIAIKQLLFNSQDVHTSTLDETLMPPPTKSLTKMIIPLKNRKLGRKKGSKGKEDVCMPQNLIKKLVTASTNRRVDKNAYEVIDAISHEFFEMICNRLDDYCHLGKRNTIHVSDVILLLKRQRIIKENVSFEDLIRDHLNKQQIDSLIEVPEWSARINEINTYL